MQPNSATTTCKRSTIRKERRATEQSITNARCGDVPNERSPLCFLPLAGLFPERMWEGALWGKGV